MSASIQKYAGRGCGKYLILPGNPGIVPDAAATERIKEQINKCPSGALSFVLNSVEETAVTDPAAPVANTNIIECLPNGPLLVQGDTIVKKSDGTEEVKTGTIALCRCGASNNKPYCDGSHRAAGFKG